jgi:hypothetical protein
LTALEEHHDELNFAGFMMLRRSLLVAGIGLLPAFGTAQKLRAIEAQAAVPKTSLIDAGLNERSRMEAVLAKYGYRLMGDLRRKGQLISTTAERDGVSWRLVIDGSNSEIIGRRLLTTPVNSLE